MGSRGDCLAVRSQHGAAAEEDQTELVAVRVDAVAVVAQEGGPALAAPIAGPFVAAKYDMAVLREDAARKWQDWIYEACRAAGKPNIILR